MPPPPSQGHAGPGAGQVLRTSEKSVEGRPGRLFAHTGYRSRVELAAAMLTGEFPG